MKILENFRFEEKRLSASGVVLKFNKRLILNHLFILCPSRQLLAHWANVG